MEKNIIQNSYDNLSYILYTYTDYWLINTLMTYENCCSHAVSHQVPGVT